MDFDNLTGYLSNPLTLTFADYVYVEEFSPDNSKLYVSCFDPSETLFQFDLNALNIQLSKTSLNVTSSIYALQPGPDGNIYVVKSFDQYLCVINFPDLQGLACNYQDKALIQPATIKASVKKPKSTCFPPTKNKSLMQVSFNSVFAQDLTEIPFSTLFTAVHFFVGDGE